MILVIEPDAKQELLTSFRRRLAARAWPTVTFCCHYLPEVIMDDTLPLPEMQNVCRRLGLDGHPRTWWNPPNDRFLVANPRPAQAPRAGRVVVAPGIERPILQLAPSLTQRALAKRPDSVVDTGR